MQSVCSICKTRNAFCLSNQEQCQADMQVLARLKQVLPGGQALLIQMWRSLRNITHSAGQLISSTTLAIARDSITFGRYYSVILLFRQRDVTVCLHCGACEALAIWNGLQALANPNQISVELLKHVLMTVLACLPVATDCLINTFETVSSISPPWLPSSSSLTFSITS